MYKIRIPHGPYSYKLNLIALFFSVVLVYILMIVFFRGLAGYLIGFIAPGSWVVIASFAVGILIVDDKNALKASSLIALASIFLMLGLSMRPAYHPPRTLVPMQIIFPSILTLSNCLSKTALANLCLRFTLNKLANENKGGKNG